MIVHVLEGNGNNWEEDQEMFDVYTTEYDAESSASDIICGSSDEEESSMDEDFVLVDFPTADQPGDSKTNNSDEERNLSSDNNINDETNIIDSTDGKEWHCIECKRPNAPLIRYCNDCYKIRKSWIPKRPMRKGKEKKKQPSASTSVEMVSKASGSKQMTPSHDAFYKSIRNVSWLCDLCCMRPKNATLIHNRLSHQISCYQCAKKLFKNRKPCPMCRRRIEKITKNVIA